MEYDDIDKRFRDFIQNDDTNLNEEEQNSKEAIWDRIDAPQKAKKVFPFWQVIAVVFLLLLSGMFWFFANTINQQNQYATQLEKELLATKDSLYTVQQALVQAKSKNISAENYNTVSETNVSKEIVEILRKEYIENVVYVTDTAFIEKNIVPQEKIKLVRDTVFIEVPAKPIAAVDLEKKKELEEGKFSKKTKSKKMEFVFNKKPLDKPLKKNLLILINETEIARRSDSNNKSNVFTIPLSNN